MDDYSSSGDDSDPGGPANDGNFTDRQQGEDGAGDEGNNNPGSESLEFAFLKPICAQVLQNASEKNLAVFEKALITVGTIPTHLTEFVLFPFAVHLKIINTYREAQRRAILSALAKLLLKAEIRNSYDMFVNVFQKLHVALSVSNNLTLVNKDMSEDEMENVVNCISSLTKVSLPFHIETICKPEKVQVFGHSIYILLQLLEPGISKRIRLETLDILAEVVNICEGGEFRSKVLFKFLPGIISALRKISLPSAGSSIKLIIQKSLHLMARTISVCTDFDNDDLINADKMLSQIVDLLSRDFVLCDSLDCRKSFVKFCCISCRNKNRLPETTTTITKIFLRMKEDCDSSISEDCRKGLDDLYIPHEVCFQDLSALMDTAQSALKSGDDMGCVLTLREIASVISVKKMSFIDFQLLLPLLFQFLNEMVWKYRNSITNNSLQINNNPVIYASLRVCQCLVYAASEDDLLYEFSSVLAEIQNNPNNVTNSTGIIVAFNNVLSVLAEVDKASIINDFEAANLADTYLYILDMQSTEIVLNTIGSEIPAVQSAAEIRRTYLLEGLGVLGKLYPRNVIPIVLYPLIEHAGLQNSESVQETAVQALQAISEPANLQTFLTENLEFILNEVSVRMLNIILYPNCPNALIFLADYFDFAKESFSSFIDQVFDRCADEFGGGNVQHIYVNVFYALMKSIFNHFEKSETFDSKKSAVEEKKSLLTKMLEYQTSVGVQPPGEEEKYDDKISDSDFLSDVPDQEPEEMEEEEALDALRQLALRVSQRVLNFLPNSDRFVRLAAMDSLILGVQILQQAENALLPLSHTIWQNLIPRIQETDYVIVRKSFDLLVILCKSCGTFLKKRTIDEAFPKLSTLLSTLATEGEHVKFKNRQYYTFTQAYKLQLTVLQGLGDLLDAIDVQEMELDKIVGGCIMYLKPDQHKNLREAAVTLLEQIASGKHSRTVWMKLVSCGLKPVLEAVPDSSFTPISVAITTNN